MIVLDTHIWIWWVTGSDRLSARHNEIIQDHQSEVIGLSDVSCLEAAMLLHRGRVKVTGDPTDWLRQATEYIGLRILPITPDIASASVVLPDHHRDPFDRIILATTQVHGATLLTADQTMHRYNQLLRID